jgi:hypothetical protein
MNQTPAEMLKIIGTFTVAAVAFGLVHDQVTVRVCIEYFAVAHETIVPWTSPTALGLVWGVVATWWAGAVAGIVVALAAREGPWPRLTWRHFVRQALWLAAAMGLSALVAGVLGYLLTARGLVAIVEDYADLIAPERHARFMADVFAHYASYAVGLLGGATIAGRALIERRRLAG